MHRLQRSIRTREAVEWQGESGAAGGPRARHDRAANLCCAHEWGYCRVHHPRGGATDRFGGEPRPLFRAGLPGVLRAGRRPTDQPHLRRAPGGGAARCGRAAAPAPQQPERGAGRADPPLSPALPRPAHHHRHQRQGRRGQDHGGPQPGPEPGPARHPYPPVRRRPRPGQYPRAGGRDPARHPDRTAQRRRHDG